VGAALGALIVVAVKSWLTANFPDAWLFVLGAMFILVTIFLPKGVLGLIEGLGPKRQRRDEAVHNAEAEPAE
jgi:urea transport system permease protein